MLIRSRAPLRLGLAGGGTDVNPYSKNYGGAVLNATISMYAYATIKPRNDGIIELISYNTKEIFKCKSKKILENDGKLDLLKGVYNRLQKNFGIGELSFTLTVYSDAPPGSGLGTSSTIVVAVLGAFSEWLRIPLGEYDIAALSYVIERKDLQMAGGKQDQYTATFGGVNFMEFGPGERVIVNPLRVNHDYLNELQINLLLYSTGQSRLSSDIILAQSQLIERGEKHSLEAMHQIKAEAVKMKEAILTGQLSEIGKILASGWKYKKITYSKVTTEAIDEIYSAAIEAGASGGKISGAGGGGFMMLYCPEDSRESIVQKISREFGGEFKRYEFTSTGLQTWKI
ncbi:MAG TPA: dehydrogenase [Dehalococcoidia bacterium]|nr:dehydrogenase [Dehalococcoidia bacterium]